MESSADFSLRFAFRGLSACPAQAESWGLVKPPHIAFLCEAARRQAGRASRILHRRLQSTHRKQ